MSIQCVNTAYSMLRRLDTPLKTWVLIPCTHVKSHIWSLHSCNPAAVGVGKKVALMGSADRQPSSRFSGKPCAKGKRQREQGIHCSPLAFLGEWVKKPSTWDQESRIIKRKTVIKLKLLLLKTTRRMRVFSLEEEEHCQAWKQDHRNTEGIEIKLGSQGNKGDAATSLGSLKKSNFLNIFFSLWDTQTLTDLWLCRRPPHTSTLQRGLAIKASLLSALCYAAYELMTLH